MRASTAGAGLGIPPPTFKAAVRRIAAACNAHGKLARGSAETEAQIEEYWQLGRKVVNLPGNDVSTYLDGLKARAGRAHARLKSIRCTATSPAGRRRLRLGTPRIYHSRRPHSRSTVQSPNSLGMTCTR
jgi:hypothetical protein